MSVCRSQASIAAFHRSLGKKFLIRCSCVKIFTDILKLTNEGRDTFSTFWKTGFNSFDQVLAFNFLQLQLPVFPQVPDHGSGPVVFRTRPLTPSPALRWRSVILWRYTTWSWCWSTFNGLRVSAVRHIQYPFFGRIDLNYGLMAGIKIDQYRGDESAVFTASNEYSWSLVHSYAFGALKRGRRGPVAAATSVKKHANCSINPKKDWAPWYWWGGGIKRWLLVCWSQLSHTHVDLHSQPIPPSSEQT